jgi:carboxyl-terminal processing protease
MTEQGAQAFVLDLRDNPGGYMSQAVSLASLFMSSGTVLVVETVDGKTAKPATGQPVTQSPVVVLVNKNTAAAAEVVAAALKENQRGFLVGTDTMGKGSVAVLHDLSFGGALQYTAAYYLTPEGHSINGVGVVPNEQVEQSSEGDFQRDYATELASSLREE